MDAIKGCDVDTIMRDTVMETSTVHTMGYTTIPIMGCASLHILWDGVVCISLHHHHDLLWGDTIYRRYTWCASLHISASLHTMGWCASSRYLLWDGMA